MRCERWYHTTARRGGCGGILSQGCGAGGEGPSRGGNSLVVVFLCCVAAETEHLVLGVRVKYGINWGVPHGFGAPRGGAVPLRGGDWAQQGSGWRSEGV